MSAHCENCGSYDVDVSIKLREEKEGNPYSRTPYRIVDCNNCPEKETQRMNFIP